MRTFGEALKGFRQASNDPDRLNRRLTQERLGELIGHEMGDLGFSGGAISEWELDKSRINAADRDVLIALACILHECGGIKTVAEAEQLLKLGKYQALDEDETLRIFQEIPNGIHTEQVVFKEEASADPGESSWLAEMFSIPQQELNQILVNAKEGPEPSWPRVLAALMRKATGRFSISRITILWIWIWLLAWWTTGPSLQLPYANRDSAFFVLSVYATGTLIIPLLIGVLVNTKDSEYWNGQIGVSPFLLRLYTYQGAGIGFNVGYFLVFPLNLGAYYLGFQHIILLEIFTAAVCVMLGSMAARVVPHNLWRAYGRLTFRDGWIFFIVALMGPLWACFFLEYHAILLRPAFGIIIILLALTGVVLLSGWMSKKQIS